MAAGQVSLELEAHEETQESNSKAATEKDLQVCLCCSVTLPPVIQAHMYVLYPFYMCDGP